MAQKWHKNGTAENPVIEKVLKNRGKFEVKNKK